MARTQGSHSETTGPRIRAAAETLFARHGYAAVSMRQIAGAVGLQAGALYNYTPDKQSLLVDLMQRHMEALLSAWGQETRGETAMSALEAFARFHIRFNLARRDAVFIAYNELRSLEPEGFAQIEALRNAYEGEIGRCFDRRPRGGPVPTGRPARDNPRGDCAPEWCSDLVPR